MLTFTADDWRDARTVTVTAGLDSDAQNDTATISHTLSGGGYDAVGRRRAVEALVVDSANPGVDVPLFDDDAAPRRADVCARARDCAAGVAGGVRRRRRTELHAGAPGGVARLVV